MLESIPGELGQKMGGDSPGIGRVYNVTFLDWESVTV